MNPLYMAEKNVCIKIGGATLDDADAVERICDNIAQLRTHKVDVVLVHGGGKDIKKQLDMLNTSFEFVEGMRVTDAATLLQVQMVLCGGVNKRLVHHLQHKKVRCAGISGIDDGLIGARKMYVHGKDIGYVGEVVNVNPALIHSLQQQGITPVVSPVSGGDDGNIYNVNADIAASKIASAVHASALIYISNVDGVMRGEKVIPTITAGEIERLIADRTAHTGMIPKLRSAADALSCGVERVHICPLSGPDNLYNALFGSGEGTRITATSRGA